MSKPLLSICIPTYNRARLLESAMHALVPQVMELGDIVELIVSDNCSDDDTSAVVEKYTKNDISIRYHRNERNLGAVGNIFKLCNELAQGDYCWLLGDDDLVRAGGVEKIIQILQANQNLDYVYVNYSNHDQVSEKGSPNLNERLVERWESLLAEDFNCLTPLYCSVFRRTVWLDGSRELSNGESFTSLETTYPHAVVFAKTMIGRSAWSTGNPWVIPNRSIAWEDSVPLVVLLRFHELLDLLIKYGVDKRLLDHHRRRMLTWSKGPLSSVIRGLRPKGLNSFSVITFAIKHYRYPEMWKALEQALASLPIHTYIRTRPLLTISAIIARILIVIQGKLAQALLSAKSSP